jgi:hypothetical protein
MVQAARKPSPKASPSITATQAKAAIKTAYAEGVRDAKQEVLTTTVDDHAKRISTLEKVMYAQIGIVSFIELMPLLERVM